MFLRKGTNIAICCLPDTFKILQGNVCQIKNNYYSLLSGRYRISITGSFLQDKEQILQGVVYYTEKTYIGCCLPDTGKILQGDVFQIQNKY